MAQAIEVKRFPGTNSHPGGRLRAQCAALTRWYGWDTNLDQLANARAAAMDLANVLNWDGVWHGGSLKSGSWVWVLEENDRMAAGSKAYWFWISPTED